MAMVAMDGHHLDAAEEEHIAHKFANHEDDDGEWRAVELRRRHERHVEADAKQVREGSLVWWYRTW